jgi:hypothetical protein
VYYKSISERIFFFLLIVVVLILPFTFLIVVVIINVSAKKLLKHSSELFLLQHDNTTPHTKNCKPRLECLNVFALQDDPVRHPSFEHPSNLHAGEAQTLHDTA